MDASKVDLLFAVKAVSKEMAGRVKALEDEVKAEALEEYENGGTDRVRSRAFGNKAGYITIKEGAPPEMVERFQVNDVQQVVDWMDEQRPETDGFASAHLEEFARWHFEQTGECPDGCSVIRYESEPGRPTAVLSVKEKVVIQMLREDRRLSGIASGLLLGDGE